MIWDAFILGNAYLALGMKQEFQLLLPMILKLQASDEPGNAICLLC